MDTKQDLSHMWNFKNDNEWYTFKKDVEKFLDFMGIDNTKVIWCPFDTEESAFVKVLKDRGYKVIHSHISLGQDFYNYEPQEHYDLILSNLPFNGKRKLVERCIELNKPFALIFGIQCFNSGAFTATLNRLEDLKFVFVPNRMKFHKGVEDEKLTAPSFHSMWICNGVGNTNKQILIMPHELKIKKKAE